MDKMDVELPSNAVKNADNSVTLTLSEPVEVAKEVIEEITLHPLKAGDILNAQNVEKTGDRTRFLIQASLRKEGFDGEKLVNELSLADLTDVSSIISFFTNAGRKTTAKS